MSVRWFARIAAPLAVACVGPALAQSPTAATTPAALAQPRSDHSIVLMRTAGQPDRQLKILKFSKYPDGESVAEVQDVESGQIFSLPGKVVATLPKSLSGPPLAAAPPVIAPPSAPAVKPVPVAPIKPAVAPKPDDGPMPKVIHIPAPTPEPVAKQPTPEIKPAAADAPAAPAPAATFVWRPRTETEPTPAPKVVPDRWQPTGRGPGPQTQLPAVKLIARATYHAADDDEPAVRILKVSVVEEHAELEPVAYRTLETQMRAEISSYVYNLSAALRPSVREEAALCLAESRYGNRREVKTVLAKAAIADPAPSVRARCIELLMALGYHDPEYLEFLNGAIAPGEAPNIVRSAARDALAKLNPPRTAN